MRLGLANGMTLLALRWWGFKEAIIVVIIRVFLGSILIGSFLQPGFILSFTGSIFSATIMGWLLSLRMQPFSIVGVSIIGAIFKNFAQLIMAYVILIRHIAILSLIPVFLITSLITGVLVGFFVMLIENRISPEVYRLKR